MKKNDQKEAQTKRQTRLARFLLLFIASRLHNVQLFQPYIFSFHYGTET